MISKEWKVARVLSMYPETLEVFVAISPHFRKLRNPLLRRALAPRVTLEQAAAIGGVRLEALLARLNEAARIGSHADGTVPAQETESWLMDQPERLDSEIPPEGLQEIALDVRPIIEGGTDPFKAIMKAVRELGENQMLRLTNSFEPVPLYSVLGGKGFGHTTKREDGIWHIWFFKKKTPAMSGSLGSFVPGVAGSNAGENMIELDVRGLAPPEPMMKILEAVVAMTDRDILLVHHHREPMMLYEKLEERGFGAVTHRIDDQYYHVVIRKK